MPGDDCYLLGTKKILPSPNVSIQDAVAAECLQHIYIKEEQTNCGVILLKGQTYMFRCASIGAYPGGIPKYARRRYRFSPKSSMGRLDVTVRAMADRCQFYDDIAFDLTTLRLHPFKEIWLEVTPHSFNVRVYPGMAMSQMAAASGDDFNAVDMKAAAAAAMLFDWQGDCIPPTFFHRDAMILSVNLTPSAMQDGIVGYKSVATNRVVDLMREDNPVETFFAPVSPPSVAGGGVVLLEKDCFYIMCTKEHIKVPDDMAAEMLPFSSNIGEMRVHYAGFFDPGFGGTFGATAVLEIRPYETMCIQDGQPICLMKFYQLSNPPDRVYGQANNHYQGQQGPTLAKYFGGKK